MLQSDELAYLKDMMTEIARKEIQDALNYDKYVEEHTPTPTTNKIDDYFIRNINDDMTCWDILNWYRNLYFKENSNTERGRMAWVIDDCFEELNKIGFFKNR